MDSDERTPPPESPGSWWSRVSRSEQIIAAVSAAIIAAASGITIALINHSNNPSPPASPTSSPPGTGSSSCITKLRMTSPSDGKRISGNRPGVEVRGQACGLVKEYGWLFNFDYGDKYYHEDYTQSPPIPIVQRDGNWSSKDYPVGSRGDRDRPYSITLVLADQQCNASLLAIKPIDDDYRLRTFPSGCRIVDRRKVYVTWP